jgi:hypothetical protein
MSQQKKGGTLSTFSEMAEQWLRENVPPAGSPEVTTKATAGMADHDPDYWRQDFRQWLESRCIQRPGRNDSTAVSALLIDFAEWCEQHHAVPGTRPTFRRLLADAGFQISDGLTSGLLLRADLQAYSDFKNHTERVLASDSLRQQSPQDSGTEDRSIREKEPNE